MAENRKERIPVLKERHHKTAIGGSKGFVGDVRDVLERYSKRTSLPHKRMIFLLILGGTLLRGWMLFEPITYDEARSFDLFVGRPVSTIISDYTDPLNHVFHSLMAKLSTSIFGINRVALRLPAFLAGILVMPLFYLFTRAMFNRYIAMLVLALVASSAPLIEYSALAHGHSLTWFFLVMAFVIGRHFVKANNIVSAVLIGVILALGMWTMVSMIYPAITIFAYLLLYILMRYKGSIRLRLNLLGLSLLVLIVVSLLLYLPMITQHGIGQLIEHPSLPQKSWKVFARDQQESAFDLWVAIADTTGTTIALLGIIAVLVSAFISIKYRLIMFAVAIGSIPLVLLQARVPPPPVWFYTLFLFHLGSGIALFYLLKFLQEKVFTKLGKRKRTAIASSVIFIGLSWAGILVILERTERFPEAVAAGAYLNEVMESGDKAYVLYPWDAPIRFHARQKGISRDQFTGIPEDGAWVFVIVAPAEDQDVEEVVTSQRIEMDRLDHNRMMKDWPRLEIFAARYRGGSLPGRAQ